MRTDHRMRLVHCHAPVTIAAALVLAACTGSNSSDTDSRARAADGAGDAVASGPGTLVFDGNTHSFRILRCDLSGSNEDGMVLQGAGELPDGRRLRVEVERRGTDHIQEQVFIVFGTLMEGDNWSARMNRMPDGRWFTDEGATEPTAGPLLIISGRDLMAEAVFERESDNSNRRGVLRARCPS